MTKAELEAERDELAERCKQDLYEAPAGMVDYSDLAMVFKAGWDSAMEHMPKWTPISEGLPDEDETVQITVDVKHLPPEIVESDVLVSMGYMDGNEWYFNGHEVAWKVLAWMPLPEAYKP